MTLRETWNVWSSRFPSTLKIRVRNPPEVYSLPCKYVAIKLLVKWANTASHCLFLLLSNNIGYQRIQYFRPIKITIFFVKMAVLYLTIKVLLLT